MHARAAEDASARLRELRRGRKPASCWASDYWLRHCDGYRVWDATGAIGRVDAVLTSDDGEPHSLVVRVGSSFSVLLTLPVSAVEGFDPACERVFVRLTDDGTDRQLALPSVGRGDPGAAASR